MLLNFLEKSSSDYANRIVLIIPYTTVNVPNFGSVFGKFKIKAKIAQLERRTKRLRLQDGGIKRNLSGGGGGRTYKFGLNL